MSTIQPESADITSTSTTNIMSEELNNDVMSLDLNIERVIEKLVVTTTTTTTTADDDNEPSASSTTVTTENNLKASCTTASHGMKTEASNKNNEAESSSLSKKEENTTTIESSTAAVAVSSTNDDVSDDKVDNDDKDDVDLDIVLPKSDLSSWLLLSSSLSSSDTTTTTTTTTMAGSSGGRHVWIVTTAGLPWMTGTAVNPLLRAISLCSYYQNKQEQTLKDDLSSNPFSVTLMIPWLVSSEERTTLYGKKHQFVTPADQESYIRKYCVDRCNCTQEIAYEILQIKFWYGKYHEGFGSIFPIEDICSTIPRNQADICILEEPEHLNWFRVPAISSSASMNNNSKKKGTSTSTNPIGMMEKLPFLSKNHKKNDEGDTHEPREAKLNNPAAVPPLPVIENPFEIEHGTPTKLPLIIDTTTGAVTVTAAATVDETNITSVTTSNDEGMWKSDIKDEDIEVLGWASKFQHVVGILHTNYADYIRQYGMATSMVTAPALNALSSLVVKAYCHKIIRLSDTLPPLDPTKEVTCNVHGVRHEFLQRPKPLLPDLPNTETNEVTTITADEMKDDGNPNVDSEMVDIDKVEIAPVYFIGKLIWAKGFERVLELEERFKMITNEYFPIDIYGGGKDEKEIQIAFFGRNGTHRGSSSSLNNLASNESSTATATTSLDEKAAAVFGAGTSLRDQLLGSYGDPSTGTTTTTVDDDDYVLVSGGGSDSSNELSNPPTPGTPPNPSTSLKKLLATPNVDEALTNVVETTPTVLSSCSADVDAAVEQSASCTSPIEVLGDLSGKTLTTTADTADATLKLIDSAMKAGLNVFSGGGLNKKKSDSVGTTPTNDASALSPRNNSNTNQPNPFQNIAPAKTRFKWRRNPVPARFLGVQDHIVIRDIAEHKIFLNMSTSEVLCTTSAEALAMGKFVILPRHCSNTFFLQFPNCLSYESWDECLEQLQFALKNQPTPLSDEHRHALSWDGATERLIKASAITKREFEERKLKGLDKADLKAAQFHVDAGTKSNWLRKKILT